MAGDRREESTAKKILWWIVGIMTMAACGIGSTMFLNLNNSHAEGMREISSQKERIVKLEENTKYTNEKMDELKSKVNKMDDKLDVILREVRRN